MSKIAVALITLGLAAPAMAGDMTVVQDGHVYTSTTAAAPLDLASQIKGSTAHERRTYDRVIAEGGCNADFIPVEYAIYCGAVPFGFPQMGSKD